MRRTERNDMSRPRVRNMQVGFGIPRPVAKQENEPWDNESIDILLNHIFINGATKHSLHAIANSMSRTWKAAKRQWELMAYRKEVHQKVTKYTPTDLRKVRELEPFGPLDAHIIRKHMEAKVPLCYTSAILQRSVRSIKSYKIYGFYFNKRNPPLRISNPSIL